MVSKECASCHKTPLNKDEVGVCKKLLGPKTKVFYCIDCFASFLDISVDDLLDKIEEFKEEGCTLFK